MLQLWCLHFLLLLDLIDFLLLFSKAQSDKQNRALEEQLNDHKYQVRIETQLQMASEDGVTLLLMPLRGLHYARKCSAFLRDRLGAKCLGLHVATPW